MSVIQYNLKDCMCFPSVSAGGTLVLRHEPDVRTRMSRPSAR